MPSRQPAFETQMGDDGHPVIVQLPPRLTVEQVTLADLRDGDIVWDEDGFWPIRDTGSYAEYFGYTVYADRLRRRARAHTNPALRVVA